MHDRDPVGDHRGQHVPPQHGRAGDRHRVEPVEDAALQIGEEPVGGVRDAAGDRDQQDAGQQVVDVVVGACLDGAAEHVDEQQHEGDRHDRRRDDGVQAARDVAHGAPEHDARVAEEVGAHRCSFLVASDLSLPTMARKISSRVGCFSTYSTFAGGSSFFSSSSVPDTMIAPSCRIAIRSASCSASSRYWVVSRTVVPLPASFWIDLPHLDARLRVEAGGRLVEEDDRRVADEAHGDVEPTAHAAGVGRHPRARPRRSGRTVRAGRPPPCPAPSRAAVWRP